MKKSRVPGFSSKKKKSRYRGEEGGVAPVLKLDRRQGSVTNAKTPVRGGGVYCTRFKKGPNVLKSFWCEKFAQYKYVRYRKGVVKRGSKF